MMLQSITTEVMRNDNFFFFTDNQNLWRKSRFHELGIRRMPRFFFLICTLVYQLTSHFLPYLQNYKEFEGEISDLQ